MGKALSKHIRVSAIGIYSADGAYPLYKSVLKRLEKMQAEP